MPIVGSISLTHSFTHSLYGAGFYLKSCHSAFQKISCFLYGTRRFITVFTKPRHWTLFWASWIQFSPLTPVSLRSILMLSTHLLLRLPVVSYLRASQPKPSKHSSHACHMSHPPHPPWFNHPNNIRWRIQAVKVIIMQFSPLSVFLRFRSKYLNTLFSETLSLCSSLKMRDHVSHPYSATGKIPVLYILIFRFFDMRLEDKRFCTE
jgi:hypothetical protein